MAVFISVQQGWVEGLAQAVGVNVILLFSTVCVQFVEVLL